MKAFALASPRYRAASWIADANRRQELRICFGSQCWAVWQMFHNEPDDNFGAHFVEDEPLVDVMALDDVLFDDLENEFLAGHVASHKPIALAEVAPGFTKQKQKKNV